jgi:hypothetical protein
VPAWSSQSMPSLPLLQFSGKPQHRQTGQQAISKLFSNDHANNVAAAYSVSPGKQPNVSTRMGLEEVNIIPGSTHRVLKNNPKLTTVNSKTISQSPRFNKNILLFDNSFF